MNQFKIEKGIPTPVRSGGRYSSYPFREMAVGDSIFIPSEVATHEKVRSAACYFGLRNEGYKFTVRKTKEPAGCRVWRT